jgi:GT2 family glycosyltransferase
MTASRNIGLKQATGEIIAFIDDDAFAHDDWLSNLLPTYDDDSIGMVGGRALNNQPDEATIGVDRIGQISKNGKIEGNFAADSSRVLEVDHVMGCNMSYRKSVLAELGGFREDYPGISGLCEDTDMCLRVRKVGYKILFNPAATVDHIGAPQAVGRRFDYRWHYFGTRNHTCLLIRNYGPLNPILLRHFWTLLSNAVFTAAKKCASAALTCVSTVYGAMVGTFAGLNLLIGVGQDPRRLDPDSESIRAALNTTRADSVK